MLEYALNEWNNDDSLLFKGYNQLLKIEENDTKNIKKDIFIKFDILWR